MPAWFKKERLTLLLGDIICFSVALLVTLSLRFGGDLTKKVILVHLAPFSILFLVWLSVFFIFDLYRTQTTIFKQRLPGVILRAQIINSAIAFLFFYLIPYFGITPKTILFIDLIVSFIFVWAWRRHLAVNTSLRRKQKIFFACPGTDVSELEEEIKNNPSYRLAVMTEWPSADTVSNTIIVFNPYDTTVAAREQLYPLLASGAIFVSVFDLYEELFGKVPLGLVNEEWCLEHISAHPKPAYDFLKRVMDIIIALPLGVVSLVVYPFIILAIKLEDGSDVFIVQERVGQRNKIIKNIKFRSMNRNDLDIGSIEHAQNKVTKVGRFLRLTRLDELPQIWNVIRGDLSLIGPRPELPKGVVQYSESIPFYALRYTIKPGLSGWAQMYHDSHPHHGVDVIETSNKLAYDLYYIKNRSFVLDLSIALKTIKTLLSISGR